MADGDASNKTKIDLNESLTLTDKSHETEKENTPDLPIQEGEINEKVERLASTLLSAAGDSQVNSSEQVMDETVISNEASKIKEHDVLDEEIEQAAKVKEEVDKELEENGGWVKILGNDQIMKKVS